MLTTFYLLYTPSFNLDLALSKKPKQCHIVLIWQILSGKIKCLWFSWCYSTLLMPRNDGPARWHKAKFKAKTQRGRLRSALENTTSRCPFICLLNSHLQVHLSSSYWLFRMKTLRRPRKSWQELSHIGKWAHPDWLEHRYIDRNHRLAIQTLNSVALRLLTRPEPNEPLDVSIHPQSYFSSNVHDKRLSMALNDFPSATRFPIQVSFLVRWLPSRWSLRLYSDTGTLHSKWGSSWPTFSFTPCCKNRACCPRAN